MDFVHKKTSKPTLPKDLEAFLEPRPEIRIRTEALHGKITLSVRFSMERMEEKIAQIKNYELSNKMKATLLEFEKAVELRKKEIEKPSENRVFFKLAVRPRFPEKKLIRMETLEGFLKGREIKDVFRLMEDAWAKPFHIHTCAEYEYESSKFKPTGGLLIPTLIPLPAELGTRFGKAEMNGISLRFKESPMGLEYIEISLEDDRTLIVGLRASYELTLLTEMLRKSYELSHEIANLLVEKVK